MLDHLPALQVIVPLISAPVCMLVTRAVWAWRIATAVSIAAFAMAVLLAHEVSSKGVLSYHLGGWVPPLGIEYRIDHLSAYILIIVAATASITMIAAHKSIGQEVADRKSGLFYSAYLLCLTGLLGIVATGDAFNIFVFLEISSLSSYALIAMGRDRRALTASYQYLIMGTIGVTFILIGVGLLYMLTGTLNIMDLQQRIPAVIGSRTLHAAFAFLTAGISLKIALFPLHLWLPNAYAYAPSMMTVFLSATATKVSLYVLFRFFFGLFSPEVSFEYFHLGKILLPLSIVAILTASFIAIFQDNIKRMLAYSSVAQIGYMTLGIGLGTQAGGIASLVYLLNHALIKGGLFLAIACVVFRIQSVQLEDFNGLGRRMPWTMSAILLLGLGLIGVPLTAGFISKWYILSAAIEQDRWLSAIVILGGSLLAILYVWKIVEHAYFRPSPSPARDIPATREAPLTMLVPLWLLVAGNFYLGLDTSFSAGFADTAMRAFFP
ncbi:MAG: monovalent cation/H+ antiporter subunit D family protein [Gammaproteobacteria bacterium]|nr:monovalent cation/H+ antiporter subunit D family protein [Gammaproteobacteria bacterium]